MIDLLAEGTAPFSIALLVMLGIGAIELVFLLIGLSPSAAIDSALPDLDAPDADLDGLPDDGGLSPLSTLLSWLSVGQVPLLVLLVIFLTSFALTGLVLQGVVQAFAGAMLPAWLAAVPALAGGALACRHLGRLFARILPGVQTDAASQKDFLGNFATILRGESRRGLPAEAKIRDARGRTHYILVEPDEAEQVLPAGSRVFLIRQEGNVYRAVTRVQSNQGMTDAQ